MYSVPHSKILLTDFLAACYFQSGLFPGAGGIFVSSGPYQIWNLVQCSVCAKGSEVKKIDFAENRAVDGVHGIGVSIGQQQSDRGSVVNVADQSCGVTRRAFLARGASAGVVLGAMPKWALWNLHALNGEIPGLQEKDFVAPPDSAKPWAYWWWLDSFVSKEGVTEDLEEMKQKGIAGALIFDAGSGGHDSPKGPAFMSDEWREYFRYAVREAGRLGIEIGINLCSGWNAGGAWVEREDAIKLFVWSETDVEGPASFKGDLKQPELRHLESSYGLVVEPQDWYREISVVACPAGDDGIWDMKKAIDLTASTSAGTLHWTVPDGKWTILRLGYRMSQARTKYSSSAFTSSERLGWEIDPLSARAMDRHFAHTGALLIQDAGPLAGRTLKYLHIDSWEVGEPTWTEHLEEEFKRRRGYDPMPYLPALTNRKVGDETLTERFLWDYRRTLADLIAENYYGRLATLAHEHGLGTHCESGGPFFTHNIDAQECLNTDDIPMGEFWSTRLLLLENPPDPNWSGVPAPFFQSTVWRNVSCDGYSGSVRQAVSCAHTYGKTLSQAESYTNFNDDWSEDPAFLKPFGDRAFCLGLTRQMLCFWVHQPELDGKAGIPMGARGNPLRSKHYVVEQKSRVAYLSRPMPIYVAAGTFRGRYPLLLR